MEFHGEGNGTPLQYSCLENPLDWGAWWAAIHGVAKSRTRLSDFTFTFHLHALEKEMATHSSVLAWRIPGAGEPGGLPSMGPHRVGHNWSHLAVEEKPQKALFPFPSSEDTVSRQPSIRQGADLPMQWLCRHSELELPTLQNWEKQLLFISHVVYGILLEQLKSIEILLERIKGVSPPIPPLSSSRTEI